MKKMKKFVAILLALAMLFSFAVTGSASGVTFELKSLYSDKMLPAGSLIPISGNAGANISGDVVEIYENGNLITALDSITNGQFSFNYKLQEGEKTLTAKIYDGDTLVAQSESFAVKGYCEDEVTPYWNVDFESHDINLNGGTAALVTNADGTTHKDLANKNTTLSVNVATTANNASVAARADGKGEAIKLEAYDTGEVQCNDFRTELTDEIVRIDFDYMIDELSASGLSKFVAVQPVLYNGSNVWATALRVAYSEGRIQIYADRAMDIDKDIWYKITAITNRANGTVDYFVDDIYLGQVTFDNTNVSKNFKICSNIKNKVSDPNGSIVWIDNLKVSGVTIKDLVDVSVPDAKYSHPEGTVVKVYANAQKLSDTAASLKLVRAADGLVISEYAGINATFDVTAGKWTQSYKVAAYSSDGKCIATSDAFDIDGYGGTTNIVWNENFTDADSSMTEGSAAVGFKRNGVELSSGRSTIVGNIGNTYTADAENINTIEVCDSSEITNKSNGDAICLTTNDTSQECQLNEMRCYIESGIAVLSVDVAVSTLRYSQLVAYANNDGSWPLAIWGTANGTITAGKDGTAIGTYSANKWTNFKFVIDISGGTLAVYIDDVLSYSKSGLATSSYPKRLNIASKKIAGKVWVDNFVATQIIKETPALEINNTEYFIDGQATQAITDGNLSITTTVTNNTQAKNVILLSAVYDSNKLAGVKLKKINFAEGDTAYTTAFDMGEVESGNKVKTMLWAENFAPVDVK